MITIPSDLHESVIAIATDSGRAIMKIYQDHFKVQIKADMSPLTQADLISHQIIVHGLKQLTPSLPVLSEESTGITWEERRHWKSYWLVDPLDGTREFVKRNGEFCINIALIHEGIPVYGMILAPVEGTIWHAMHGGQAFRRDGHRDTTLHVRAPAGTALQVAASRSHIDVHTSALLAQMKEITLVSQGSALKFCRLAEGTLDVYPRLGATYEWDTAAGQCLLLAAGGTLLNIETGKPFRYNKRETLLNGGFIALGDATLPWRDWLP
ncbi:3'(2'),5'-bisphosphate nucleotidase CysQ [Xylella fastidiosa subsp. fastidiosa]|uniref:3'(2'),5'-bisphosphate nucleotidase CysQ n=1 Tax=Xylella fastidiosa (strain M23) TaxID=405441 RepID=B2I6Q5_XYLF2|nr:3'(2'),5'-bisphosphate nucleotidase CysQ [Xylella fastidiosa]ADN63145.1 3'(2'),5'-bisphosphate nucleotidase [Xylella fastidiosa subsp. fastidiosa GB514]KAF0571769.1 3'-5'-bisphosphate nucleotidase [Xylella fastidiosa subsp. fastidiosa Mus-1]ACB91597.1 3'(2'),5'-bisphosphate nucleotidase [Xylella fastidiosa M23]KGM21440.1 3'-5'-bisphosphate nucleotidase [Xylella fastidiosa]MBE0262026.1 3'(2'),5'-bisphosphate nucleotidase CysQ [Xylella fastidiosa subsp. fastidiosa]